MFYKTPQGAKGNLIPSMLTGMAIVQQDVWKIEPTEPTQHLV